jgi:DNA topoisomerase-1
MKSIPKIESMQKLWTGGDWTPPASEAAKNKAMLAVIDTVAANLGNTRTVCRSSYIHPWFLDAWAENRLAEKWAEFEDMRAMGNMTSGESTTLRILKSVVKG